MVLLPRLGKLWMYDAPIMFWAVWQLVSPFIDPDTKEKVTFVSSKSAVQEFQQAIDASVCSYNLYSVETTQRLLIADVLAYTAYMRV